MIKSVTIQNYQSLKDVELELGKFTVICGPSNSGKSAFFRAVQALCTNERGRDFISRGADKASVRLVTDDGVDVTWEKGTSAKYVLNGTEYSRMGQTVPGDVVEALNIRPIDVDGLTLSPQFAGQFDSPFLLTESSRRAARVISKVTRLDVILTAAAAARKDMGRAKQTLDQHLTAITERQTSYDELSEVITGMRRQHNALRKAYKLLEPKARVANEAAENFVELVRLDDEMQVQRVSSQAINEVIDAVEIALLALSKSHTYVELRPLFTSTVKATDISACADEVDEAAEIAENYRSFVLSKAAFMDADRRNVELRREIKALEEHINHHFPACPTCGTRKENHAES